MSGTEVVHCKREKYDVYIRRPSKWGNPFEIGKDGSRGEVISKDQTFVRNSPELLQDVKSLKGLHRGCWCHPHPCHGDILVELAEQS